MNTELEKLVALYSYVCMTLRSFEQAIAGVSNTGVRAEADITLESMRLIKRRLETTLQHFNQ